MDVIHTLLILSGSLAYTRGQDSLSVALLPNFPYLYASDEVTLLCKRGKDLITSPVKWYRDGKILPETKSSLYIPMVTQDKFGKYKCEENNVQSSEREIVALNLMPHARLTPRYKKLMLIKGGGYHMELYVETGLQGWSCMFTMNGSNWLQRDQSVWKDDNRSMTVYTEIRGDNDKSTTYWCRNKKDKQRSNAVTIRATDKKVMLQTVDPVYEGDPVTLQCDDWEVNADSLEEVFFYKGADKIPTDTKKDTYTILHANVSNGGSYKCSAKRRQNRKRREAAPTEDRMSDEYTVRVIGLPPEAHVTSHVTWLSCECQNCQGQFGYRWYRGNTDSDREKLKDESKPYIYPKAEGHYSCRAEWASQGLSRPSNVVIFKPDPNASPFSANTMLVVLLIIVAVIIVLILIIFWWRRKTGTSGKKLGDGEDGGYEAIKLKEGEYEELKGAQTQVYQTLKDGQKGKEQGDQLYEALKDQGEGKEEGAYQALKGGTQADVYHTLKGQGEGKEEGAYQALKGGTQADVYHTLKGQGEGKEEGAYEALKSTQAEVYHTLQGSGGSKEEGAYEALKPSQSDVYHTLKEGGEGKKDQDEALLPKEAVPGEKVGHGEGAGQA